MSRVMYCALALGLLTGPLTAQSRPAAPATATPKKGPATATGLRVEGFGPNGATLRCRDGSFPAPGAADAACASKGGVAQRYPVRRYYDPSAPENRASARATAPGAAQPRAGATAGARDQARPPRPADLESNTAYRARVAAERSARRNAPAGATILCGDGTYVVRDTSSTACGRRGGVKVRLSQTPARP